ncbi:hypothetical protein LEP1GSC017_0731 [Leptospira meyeri serovar Hardjo str. Went 5]|nr:hypothetical protein LEP1GSC017_0731 [Leptospira meyeri serovar Hardjo str. Went 5]
MACKLLRLIFDFIGLFFLKIILQNKISHNKRIYFFSIKHDFLFLPIYTGESKKGMCS